MTPQGWGDRCLLRAWGMAPQGWEDDSIGLGRWLHRAGEMPQLLKVHLIAKTSGRLGLMSSGDLIWCIYIENPVPELIYHLE